MASVEFEHIDKIYPGGTQAIFDFSLSIADGEALALVGPSGCGKSTLLRLLAGLETPSRGLLRIGGQVVNAQPPQQRNVAMVFQDYALYPHMTVRRNLEFPLRMRDLPRADIDRQVHWVTELLGLDGLSYQVVVLFAAMPTASSAYILAMRMGGDGRSVAWLISASTLGAMLTLPLWAAWLIAAGQP